MIARLAGLALLVAALGTAAPAAQHQGASWTRAWTASPWEPTAENVVKIDNATLRATVRVAAGGTALRLRLANDFGKLPVHIGAASVRGADGRTVRVTFGGAGEADIGAGAPLVSDSVALAVKPFELIEVSLYLPGAVTLNTAHLDRGNPTRVLPGNQIQAAGGQGSTVIYRPLIAGVDVRTARPRPVVVAYGDSITDNTGCANDAPVICRWSDVLARRLAAAGKPHVVVTQAITGNRILTPGTAQSALARLDRDVLAVPGVSHIVLLEGINDIGNSGLERNGVISPKISAAQLIAGYRQLVLRAHERGIKVVALTILPFEGAGYYSPEREAIRREVNAWIRSSGTFDAVVDMEKVVADPGNPNRLAANLQGGDNLHPDGRGETKMGEAIPLELFK